MSPAARYEFGPFEFDADARRLTRADREVPLSDRQATLLSHLIARAGIVVAKDDLVSAVWGDVAVTDNSLEQMVSALRRLFRDAAGDDAYLETVPRRGYRFRARVTRLARRESDDDLEALLAPHRAWVEGRAALESLDQGQITRAHDAFQSVVERVPDMASAHVGLANACVMRFETTRVDQAPDRASLERAATHAREACRLDPAMGEAWATLGFVLARQGVRGDGLAAARRSVTLEPDNWRHHLRLGFAGWGEERLRAARRTLALLPAFPLAHWLAATVHIARQALDAAAEELDAGLTAAVARPAGESRWSPVALHWLRGLVHRAHREDDHALACLASERALADSGHLYARETAAAAAYATGAIHLRQGRPTEARAAFEDALVLVPGHPMARVGVMCLEFGATDDGAGLLGAWARGGFPSPADAAVAMAAGFSGIAARHAEWAGRTRGPELAAFVEASLASADPGSAGWILPVEPLIQTLAAPDLWAPALARLRARAD